MALLCPSGQVKKVVSFLFFELETDDSFNLDICVLGKAGNLNGQSRWWFSREVFRVDPVDPLKGDSKIHITLNTTRKRAHCQGCLVSCAGLIHRCNSRISRIKYFSFAGGKAEIFYLLESSDFKADRKRSTFSCRAVWPIRPTRQIFPARGPRPAPISILCLVSRLLRIAASSTP